jgi:Fic family protein
MAALEGFYHDTRQHTSILIKAALAHVQFETIHPFLDGNGRLGRLLIALILCADKILQEPLLYLSLYFKSHRKEYYALLQRVRADGDWEAWVDFFAEAVDYTARQAIRTASLLVDLCREDQEKIGRIKRVAGTVLRIHNALVKKPLLTIPKVCEITGLHPATAASALKVLQKLGIVREITGKRRNRAYTYDRFIAILNEGTEPLDIRR